VALTLTHLHRIERRTVAGGSEIFGRLQECYHLTGDEHFREILETLLTPDEAGIILELFAPLTPAELAVKMNMDAISLAAKMVSLAQRGLLYREKEHMWLGEMRIN
jgi:predicted transcriptional regulator